MKRFFLTSVVLLSACTTLGVSPVLAQPPEGGRRAGGDRPPFPPGGFMAAMPLMKALDADRDGQLSDTEIQNASKALMTLDSNGDGALSMEELRPDPSQLPGGGPMVAGGEGPPNPQMMMRMFEQRDADGDGKLTGDEIPERMRERVNMVDTDGDNAISKEEMQKALARMANQGGPGRPERDGKDGSAVRPRRPPQN